MEAAPDGGPDGLMEASLDEVLEFSIFVEKNNLP